jgi:hypothetical protein
LKSSKQQSNANLTYWLCGKLGHLDNRFPQGEQSNKNKGKISQKKARQRAESSRQIISIRWNICGSSHHDTNQCRHHPFPKREEVHMLQEVCCQSTDTSEFEYFSIESSDE